jgi:glycine cleavage system regulatory protein
MTEFDAQAEAIKTVEDTIHEADTKGDWKARYEHLANAHRAQARRNVEVEHELADSKVTISKQAATLRELRGRAEELETAVEQATGVEREQFDTLYRLHMKTGKILAAVVGELVENGEALLAEDDLGEWACMVDTRNGIVQVRAIAIHPAGEPHPDADED